MEYEILTDVKVKLNKVTPKALKFYKETGLLDPKTMVESGVMEILLNQEIVGRWLKILFLITEEQHKKCVDEFENLDYEQVIKGHQDFFGRLWKPSS